MGSALANCVLRVCLCLCKRQLAAGEESIRLRGLPCVPVGRQHRLHKHTATPTSVLAALTEKKVGKENGCHVELPVGSGAAGCRVLQRRAWEW